MLINMNVLKLHLAAWFGRLDIVEELLSHDAAIDHGADEEVSTPLAMAAEGGHLDVMKKLMLRGADPNSIDKYDGPVINSAISSGKQAAVELLVNTGKVSLWIDRDGIQSPLQLAASSLSDISMFNYLVEKYADKLPASEYNKALIAAAEAGQMEVFSKLTEYHHPQDILQRAVEAAADEDNWDIVLALLDKYPALGCEEILYMASISFEEREDVLEAIWKYTNCNRDGNITASKIDESLYQATDREKAETVKLLLEKFHANPNAVGEEFGNALTAAAYDGNLPILKSLLRAGADVNAAEGYAIQTAADEGHLEVVDELIRWNADVNAFALDETFLPGTALQAACEDSKLEIVRLLLQHGANPNLGRGEYSPPIIAASRFGDEKILRELVTAKAEIDAVGGSDKSSALIYAVACHPVSSLQLLVEAGANVNLVNASGDTALIVACRIDDDKSVALLLDNGADITRSNKQGADALQTALVSYSTSCFELLVDRVSALFAALHTAMDSGDIAICKLVRSVAGLRSSANINSARSSQHEDQLGASDVEVGHNEGDERDISSTTGNTIDFPEPDRNRSSRASHSDSVEDFLDPSSLTPQPFADTIHTGATMSFVPHQVETQVHATFSMGSREQSRGIGKVNHIRRKPAPQSSSPGLSPAPSSVSVLGSNASSNVFYPPMTTPPPSNSNFASQYRNISGNSTPDPSAFGNIYQTPVASPTPSYPRTVSGPATYREGDTRSTNTGSPHTPRYATQLNDNYASGVEVRRPGSMERGQHPTTPSPGNQNHPPSLRPGYGYGSSSNEVGRSEYRGVVQGQHQQNWQQRPSNQQHGHSWPSPGPPRNDLGTDEFEQQQFAATPPRTPFWHRK